MSTAGIHSLARTRVSMNVELIWPNQHFYSYVCTLPLSYANFYSMSVTSFIIKTPFVFGMFFFINVNVFHFYRLWMKYGSPGEYSTQNKSKKQDLSHVALLACNINACNINDFCHCHVRYCTCQPVKPEYILTFWSCKKKDALK